MATSFGTRDQASAFCMSLVAQSCPTLCNLMDCSIQGFPVLHYFPELTQTHVHWVGSILFSHSAVSDSLQSHGLQHARLSCLSPTPGAFSNSRPSSCWCHPTVSSFVFPVSSCLQSFPASGSSHLVAKVLDFQLQHQSSQWIFRTDFL